MTGQISGAAHILAIDSADHASLWATLESQYGLAVSRLTGAETALATIQRDRPDLIILNASLTDPSASSLLALFTEQKLTLPVVLIGVNGEVTDKNFNYKHIIGWLNQSFSASDLVALIQAALERSWPTGDLVLAKRAELIEANCQFAHRVQELQTLFEIGKSVTSLLDLEAVLPRVVQAAVYLTDADESYLFLLDETTGNFYLHSEATGKAENLWLKVDDPIVKQVIATGEPFVLSKERDGFKVSADLIVYSLINVPIKVRQDVIGVLGVDNRTQPRAFTYHDQELLSALADWAAIAIQNARQYAALKQANETLRQLQAQRIASERWLVLGKAAGNLAHRINNTTALVPVAAQHLRELLNPIAMSPELRQEVGADLDRIQRNTLYTVELASNLMRRFRQNPTSAYNINEIVEQALALVKIPETIKVVQQLEPDLLAIETTELLIDAIVELITNAVRAMSDHGGLLRLTTFKTGADQVSIQVTDTGPGIARDKLARVFDMFYTTSPHGFGFGLWWVKTFLEQQHGEIIVESRPPKGTTFTITLPRHLPSLHSSQK